MLLCLPPFFWLVKRGIFIIWSSSRKEAVHGGSCSSCYMMRKIRIEVLILRSIHNSPQYHLLMYYYTYKMHTLNSRSPSLSHLFLFSFFSFLRFWSLLILHLSCIQSTLHQSVSTLVFHVSVVRIFLEGKNVATNVDSLQRNAGSSIKSRAQQRLKWRAIKVVAKYENFSARFLFLPRIYWSSYEINRDSCMINTKLNPPLYNEKEC